MQPAVRPLVALAFTGFCSLAILTAQTPTAQPPQPDQRAPEPGPDIRPGEVQQLFDAYVLVQIQISLGLNEQEYTNLLPRLRVLQQTRRRMLQERQRLIGELQKLTNPRLPEPAEESLLKERVSALQELESRYAADLRRAYDGVDEVLNIRQRARFRVFEEQVERRKLQLLLRATRQQNQRPPPPSQR
jgi:DNA repair ATPase RecN